MPDPYQVFQAFDYATENPNLYEGIITDSITFLMDMYETMYVIPATNTQKAWGDFAQYWKILMQDKVAKYKGAAIFTAHMTHQHILNEVFSALTTA